MIYRLSYCLIAKLKLGFFIIYRLPSALISPYAFIISPLTPATTVNVSCHSLFVSVFSICARCTVASDDAGLEELLSLQTRVAVVQVGAQV